ncbi:hypothetical protein AVEN_174754-1 [Araneus ventricosus]|uniref:Uncharacterized protein n=1 Tax=Araneus ventricosus TaxID=182803 RepID=A0A4Y2BLA6_ARAVE|nr:hypothetical protein AVEN_174754-1 [Araneus ventricosus]
MDLLTALQDSWCEFPPRYLQTLVESMPRRFASLLRDRGGRHDIKKMYQFFWLFSVTGLWNKRRNSRGHSITPVTDQTCIRGRKILEILSKYSENAEGVTNSATDKKGMNRWLVF